MSERFTGLKKIPNEPAMRMLSEVNAKLKTPLKMPASAPVDAVLAELEKVEAWIDILRMLSIALPPRESIWWACLAARDLVGEGDKNTTPCLKAAENWVFNPTDEAREAARASLDNVYVDDDTSLCATAAMYAAGNMGPGDMAEYPAPAGAVSSCVFGMNVTSLGEAEDFEAHMQLLIDRAVDIARGGNGEVEKPEAVETEPEKEKGGT